MISRNALISKDHKHDNNNNNNNNNNKKSERDKKRDEERLTMRSNGIFFKLIRLYVRVYV